MCSSALCTMDDASYFLVIRLGPKTSECEKNVIVMSTVTSCEVTNCATTLHGVNKQISHLRPKMSRFGDRKRDTVFHAGGRNPLVAPLRSFGYCHTENCFPTSSKNKVVWRWCVGAPFPLVKTVGVSNSL